MSTQFTEQHKKALIKDAGPDRVEALTAALKEANTIDELIDHLDLKGKPDEASMRERFDVVIAEVK